MERLRNLEEKISHAIEKVKVLKVQNNALEEKVKAMEELLGQKDMEIEALQSEKTLIKQQIETLLNELETLQLG